MFAAIRDIPGAAGPHLRRHRHRADLAGGPRRLRRPDRDHRLLHGRRVRTAACPHPPVHRRQRQLRNRGQRCAVPGLPERDVPHRRQLRRQGPRQPRRRPAAGNDCSPTSASTTTSRNTPTRDTPSSTITIPPTLPRCSSCSPNSAAQPSMNPRPPTPAEGSPTLRSAPEAGPPVTARGGRRRRACTR